MPEPTEAEPAGPVVAPTRGGIMFGVAVGTIAVTTALFGTACPAYGCPDPGCRYAPDSGTADGGNDSGP